PLTRPPWSLCRPTLYEARGQQLRPSGILARSRRADRHPRADPGHPALRAVGLAGPPPRERPGLVPARVAEPRPASLPGHGRSPRRRAADRAGEDHLAREARQPE